MLDIVSVQCAKKAFVFWQIRSSVFSNMVDKDELLLWIPSCLAAFLSSPLKRTFTEQMPNLMAEVVMN